MESTEELYARQQELEMEMTSIGAARYREVDTQAGQGGRYSVSDTGSVLMKMAIDPMAKAITDFIEEASRGTVGKRHTAVKYLRQIDPEVAALLTAKTIIDQIALRASLQKVALTAARMIEDDLRFQRFAEEKPHFFNKVMANQQARGKGIAHQSKVLRAKMEELEISWDKWPEMHCAHLGMKLIDLFIQATGMVEKVTQPTGRGKTVNFLVASATCMEALKDRNARRELMRPALLPMLVVPNDWTNPFNGGYLTGVKRFTLVKTRNKNYLDDLANTDMPEVYDAINTLQHSAFRIHAKVHAVIQHFRERGLALAGLPKATGGYSDVDLPPKPADIDTNKEALTRWKQEAALVYDERRVLLSKNMAVNQTLWVAQKFVEEKAIYFIWNMDFRGRCYATNSPALNPQGNDLAKGLIEFAEGKPVRGNEGAPIAVQLANMVGECPVTGTKVDKLPLQERIDWSIANISRWKRIAADPINEIEWTNFDKPVQGLAALLDFVAFWEADERGEAHVSHLVCSSDGSNNGLQHMAAMVRDEKGGAMVNLIPGPLPSDIYLELQKAALKTVKKDAAGGDELAKQWLKMGITRSTCKRPCMTRGYGATLFGYTDQILEDTIRPAKFAALNGQGVFPFEGAGKEAASYLASVFWESMNGLVPAAAAVMDWLKDVSKLAASEGLPVHWTTPVGFPVLQAYEAQTMQRVKTMLCGSVVKFLLPKDTGKLDRRKQSASISPNVVHSYDAAAMMKTINRCTANGVTAFAMVHDSFGTHALDAPMMSVCLRSAFVEIYEEDVLQKLKDQIEWQLDDKTKEKIPPLPKYGNLDVSAVRDSEFFFA